MTKELREKIQEIMFATCPVDTQDPFFWKWNEHGLDMLESFYEQEIIEAERRMKERIRQNIAEEAKRISDGVEPTMSVGDPYLVKVFHTKLEMKRINDFISSLK